LDEFCLDTHQSKARLRAGIANDLRWASYVGKRLNDNVLHLFYKANKDYFDGTTVRVSHIVLRLPSGTTEKEKARTYAKMVEIRNKVLNDPNADFAELAHKYSQDAAAERGGDLGFISRKWVD